MASASGTAGDQTKLPTIWRALEFNAMVGADHDLWQVEKFFRMAKSDVRTRPIFHRERDAIEADLTIVVALARQLHDG